MSEEAFGWFENLCDEFSRNPEGATAELSRFRQTEEAYTISQVVIQNSTKPHAQFHALAVLQHSYLMHYRQFNSDQNIELRNFLWSVIVEKGTANTLDQSVATKLIHVFALVLKRNWMNEGPEQRSGVFNMISVFISENATESPIRYKIAAKIVSTILEVFAKKKRTPDESIGYSPELQGTIHLCFQEDSTFCGLIASYQVTLQLLSKAFELSNTSLFATSIATDNGTQMCFNYQVASVVKTIYDLLTDLFGWDFDSANSSASATDEKFECGAVHLPAAWVELAGGSDAFNDILGQLMQSYELVRIALFGRVVLGSGAGEEGGAGVRGSLVHGGCSFGVLGAVSPSSSSSSGSCIQSVRIAGEYISSIRQLLLTFASFSSGSSPSNSSSSNGMFGSDAEKIGYSNQILLQMISVLGYGVTALVNQSFHSSGSNGGASLTPEQVEDLLLNEVEHAIYILIRLFGNFHLSVIGQAAAFESFMVSHTDTYYI
jgi:hypothetical protein